MKWLAWFLLAAPGLAAEDTPQLRLARLVGDQAELVFDGAAVRAARGGRCGPWTLVEVLPAAGEKGSGYAVLEDYGRLDGHLILVGRRGVELDLAKTSEPTTADPSKLYLGHTREEVLQSARDLLGGEILAKPGDPNYDAVAGVFEPIRKMQTYSFLGTHDNPDKVGFAYGGRSPNFDPAPYDPHIQRIRDEGRVLDGLVGGSLPVLRFVYPDGDGDWTEMIAFAPLRISNGNDRIQPVWYRLSRIEGGRLRWAKYVDSYHPFPPRADYDPKEFYKDLAALEKGWKKRFAEAMEIDLPDQRTANMARFALVREMMTRVGDFPKYGAVDRDYAGSEHDGFPDTFTVDTTTMLEWGLTGLARGYIDNYFGKFVRDDGSLLYRGPEIGQYGRMLTVLAEYVNLGGDPELLLKHRSRIDGITGLLLGLRAKAKTLAENDPARGMIAGWSEADASLDPAPERYMQPYFSNSTEAARGFRDLGRVWEKIGKRRKDAGLARWGRRLVRESTELRKDLGDAMARSLLTVDGERILPAIAGVKEPFHVAVPRDKGDPQFRSYRAYMEMMYSGSLTREQVRWIADYRSHHHDMLLGVPTAYGYNTADLAGFLSYGHAYGLIQHDMIRESLLLLYAVMAHQYTRGTWTAPETRNVLMEGGAAPYCTPAQLVVPLVARWMLVFEDPESETLWIAKAVPRDWLADGKTTAARRVPTRWGRAGFRMVSHLHAGFITAELDLPAGAPVTTRLRLRAPGEARLNSVLVNGKPWEQFDAKEEVVTLPPGTSGKVRVEARYR
jgi:hypothetical protein